jgi:hypothetical protein
MDTDTRRSTSDTMALDLVAVEARATRAEAELDRLTTGNPSANWRWGIPANPDRDSDLILSASVADVRTLLAEVQVLRAQPRPIIDGRAFHYDDRVYAPFHARQLSDGRWAFRTGNGYGSPIVESSISADAAHQLATMILDAITIPDTDPESGNV